MQVRMAGARAGNGKGEADQLIAVESPDDLATNLAAHDEHPERDKVDIVKIPNFFLQRDAGLQLLHAVALADGNLINAGHCGAHFAGSSMVLACCHNVSISSSVACSSVRPCRRNCSSIQPKRRRNFRLVCRKADSESMER